jgi:hypothetical protein
MALEFRRIEHFESMIHVGFVWVDAGVRGDVSSEAAGGQQKGSQCVRVYPNVGRLYT